MKEIYLGIMIVYFCLGLRIMYRPGKKFFSLYSFLSVVRLLLFSLTWPICIFFIKVDELYQAVTAFVLGVSVSMGIFLIKWGISSPVVMLEIIAPPVLAMMITDVEYFFQSEIGQEISPYSIKKEKKGGVKVPRFFRIAFWILTLVLAFKFVVNIENILSYVAKLIFGLP